MSEKRYPKDLQVIFQTTRADLEVQLAESENFVLSTNSKAFDTAQNAVMDTQNLVGGFVKEKAVILDKSSANGKSSVESLKKTIQNISNLQARMSGFDKSKDLITFKESIIKDFDAEVMNIYSYRAIFDYPVHNAFLWLFQLAKLNEKF